MKIHWKTIVKEEKKTIAKAFELHNEIRKHEMRVIGVIRFDRPPHDSKHQ
jgi:hypothetical protein